jgi:hypothetical protein
MICGYLFGAAGICIGILTYITFPEEIEITDNTITKFGQYQWINGFFYGISSTLLVGSFCLGRCHAIKTA